MQRKNWVIPGFLVLAILLLLSFPALASADDIIPAAQAENQPVVDGSSQATAPVPEQQKDDKLTDPVSETTTPDSGTVSATTPEQSTPAASDPGQADSSQPAETPDSPVASDSGQVDSSQPAETPDSPAASDSGQGDSSQPAETPDSPAASDPGQVDSSQPAETPDSPVASDPGQADSSQPAETPDNPAASDPGQGDSSQPAETPDSPAASDPGQGDSSQPAETPDSPAASDPDQADDGNPVLEPVESEQDVPVSSPELPVVVPEIQEEVQPAPVVVVPNTTQQNPASGAPVVVVSPQTGEYAPGYMVEPGDTLQTISQKTGVSVEDLKKANGLDVPDDTVAVPRSSSASTDSSKDKAGSSETEPTLIYQVRAGESLWLIGMKLGVPYEAIMAANHLTDYIIYPEQELIIPGIKLEGGLLKYRIMKGDTLYLIGRALGLDYEDIMSLNGLKDFWIYPGNELVIPDKNSVSLYKVKEGETLTDIARKFNLGKNEIYGNKISGNKLVEGQVLVIPQAASVDASRNMQVSSAADLSSASDLELLARAIYAEARGEVYEGKVAVGAVILNRLEDPAFPKTIRDIIFQPLAFTSVDDGQINLTPDEESYKAAKDALNGADPSLGALYYWNPNVATSKWIWTRPIIKQIGEHVFAR